MKLNDYMHPRNPFKIKPDYKLLAEKHPWFEQYLIPFYPGSKKFKIDFSDPEALRCLSTVLLKEKFDLNVHIPTDRLIPCIPQRLNYILWVEDLIEAFSYNVNERNYIIDCGTGASCVLPLIAAKMNKNWYFIATEIDEYSLELARENCKTNRLTDRINVMESYPNQFVPIDCTDQYTALMCNPPFFDSRDENGLSSRVNSSALIESTFEGGEESFVSKLIDESLIHRDGIRLYTVMLGRKTSFKNLKKKLQSLKDDQVLTYTDTKFFQGRTIRWGLCWTFDLSINLNSIREDYQMPSKKKNPTFVHEIPESKFVYTYSLKLVTNHILDLLSNIQIDQANLTGLKKSKHKTEFNIRTNLNTWSHQRRRRRLAKQQISVADQNEKFFNKSNEEMKDESEVNRKRTVDFLESSFEDLDISHSTDHSSVDENWKKARFSADDVELNEFYLLNCIVTILEDKEKIYLKMTANRKVKDKDSVHQLFQYLKNNL